MVVAGAIAMYDWHHTRGIQVCAKAKFRHHHVNVMREIALDKLGLGAAFVAGHRFDQAVSTYKDLAKLHTTDLAWRTSVPFARL
jgi:hypothetical protein